MDELRELEESVEKAKSLPMFMKANAVEGLVDRLLLVIKKQDERIEALEVSRGK